VWCLRASGFSRALCFSIGSLPAVASSSAQAQGLGWFLDFATNGPSGGVFAQVGEWLKPTDCKSVPPCEVRRFESFPVHQVWFAGVSPAGAAAEIPSGARDRVKRLIIALSAFVALGILSWSTISDQRIRLVTLAVLAMYALKTWVRRKDVLHPGKNDVET
jgi:hypothetical protein